MSMSRMDITQFVGTSVSLLRSSNFRSGRLMNLYASIREEELGKS
jgi:hypothetical protein